jgi:hypothetical protein
MRAFSYKKNMSPPQGTPQAHRLFRQFFRTISFLTFPERRRSYLSEYDLAYYVSALKGRCIIVVRD